MHVRDGEDERRDAREEIYSGDPRASQTLTGILEQQKPCERS